MGKTEINDRIGIHADIGPIAGVNQATCTSTGCKKLTESCVWLILYWKNPNLTFF
jgi:hypothetical protein